MPAAADRAAGRPTPGQPRVVRRPAVPPAAARPRVQGPVIRLAADRAAVGVRGWGPRAPRAARGETLLRRHRSATPQGLRPAHQLIRRHHRLRLQLEIQSPLVVELARHQVLADEVQRRDLVPRRTQRLGYVQRFIAVLDQADVAVAVIDKRRRDGRNADLIVVHVGQRPGRIAADGHLPLDTPGRHGGSEQHGGEEEG